MRKLNYLLIALMLFGLLATPFAFPKNVHAAFSQTLKIGGCTFFAYLTDTKGKRITAIAQKTPYNVVVEWKPGEGDNQACDNFDSVEMGYYTTGVPYGLIPQYCDVPAPITNSKRIAKAEFTTAEDTVIRRYIIPKNGPMFCAPNEKKPGYQGEFLQLNGAISTTTMPGTTTPASTNSAPSNTNSPPNSAINTNTGFNFNGSLDDTIGTFFNPLSLRTVPEIIGALIRILFVLIGLVSVIIIIIAGFRMVTASGNEEQLTKAKKAITWAIVGLIVSLLSFSIVSIIQALIARPPT